MSQAAFNDDNDDDDDEEAEEAEEEEDDPSNLSISTSSAGRRRMGSGQRAMGHTDTVVVLAVGVVVSVAGGCFTVTINVGSVKASSNDRTAKLVPDQSGE